MDVFLLVTAFLSIIYLQFYATFRKLELTPGLGFSKWNITIYNASFLVVLFTLLIILIHLKLAKLTPKRVSRFAELLEELMTERRYAEIFSLSSRHLLRLSKIYHSDFLSARIRKHLLDSFSSYAHFPESVKQSHEQSRTKKLNQFYQNRVKPLLKPFEILLPNHEPSSEIAQNIVRNLILSKNVVKATVEIKPYWALEFLKRRFQENQEFLDLYLRELLSDASSILYFEIRHNQNLSALGKYDIPQRNRLLYFLFNDASVAEKLGVYRPVGEYVISELQSLGKQPSIDPYNQTMGDFHDRGKWESSIFVGIRFFDIMVSSALHQNIRWHMWLSYVTYFTEEIIGNYSSDSGEIESFSEWPTRYHYLLYTIVDSLCDWIRPVRDLPKNQENIKLENSAATHQNDNIPKSSILALGYCIKKILKSDKFHQNFKNYIIEIVFYLYLQLKEISESSDYAKALLNAMKAGGIRMMSRDPIYIETLTDSLSSLDQIKYGHEIDEIIEHINKP